MPFLIPAAIAIGSAVATAAFVVSDILIPVALGAIGVSGAALAGASAFAFAATTTIVETAALAGISALISPHPNVNSGGSPQQFKPDPNASIPVIMGRYGVGGNLVYQTTSGGSNKAEAGARGNEYLTSFVILGGLGPYQAFETLRFNDTILTFDPKGQACNGGYIPYDEVQEWNPGYRHQNADQSYINNNYQDRAWQNFQLGALNAGYFAPPSKLASDNAGLPEWTNAHGFSGFCAASLTLVYDQRYYAGGVPQFQWVVQGQKVYDPRQDSTYPGGNGPQRWVGEGATAAQIDAARATWTFSQNPDIHALNFALGHFLPDGETGLGRLYAGIGAGTAGVDIPAFVAAANVADANGWLICGQWTTGDGKWSVITEMLKAGSATPVIDCGIISCIVDQPLTSLGTVTADDLSGPITLPTGSSFTARVNTIFPRYTSEAHRWQMVQADTPVKAATYVTEDGAVRSKTLDWQYVPAVNQACQLAAYTITNGREIPGIQLPGKPKLRNYRVGDCFDLDIDEAGLATTKVMVTKRVTDQATGGVTLTVRTETDAKHAYSLGVSGVAPATPGISGVDPTIVEAPLPDFWATGALEVTDNSTGESRVVIRVTGSADDAGGYAQTVVLRWRPVALVGGDYTPTGDQSWSYRSFPASQGQFDLDLNPGVYDVQIAYITVNGAYPSADQDFLDLGIETVGGSTSADTAAVGGMEAQVLLSTVAQATSDIETGAESDIAQMLSQAQNAVDLTAATYAQSLMGALSADKTAWVMDPNTFQVVPGQSMTARLASIAGDITGAQTNITVLQATSSSNTAAIGTEQVVRAQADSALSTTITSLTATVGGVSAAVTTEQTARATADTAIAASVTALSSTVSTNTAAIQSEASTRATADSAQAAQLTSLTATVGSNTSAISTETVARTSGDAALSYQLTTTNAAVASNAAAIQTETSTRASADSAQAAQITSLTATAGSNTAAIQSETVARASGDQVLAGQITNLNSTLGSLSATVSTNYTTLVAANAATAASVTTLQAGPGANLVPNPSFNQGATGWTLLNGAYVTSDSSIGSYLAYSVGQGDLGATDIPIAYSPRYPIQYGYTFADQAMIYAAGIGATTSFARVGVQFFDASGKQVGYDCVQTNVQQGWTRILRDIGHSGTLNAPSSTASFSVLIDFSSNSGNLQGAGGELCFTKLKLEPGSSCTPYTDDQVGAAINTEQVARVSGDSSLASSITSLTATVGGNTSAIQQEASVRASADSSAAATVTSLTSTVNTNTAAISSEAYTRAANDSSITSTVNSLTSSVGANSSSITSEAATRAASDSALSSRIDTVTATAGANTASLSAQSSVIATMQGQLLAYWSITAAAGGLPAYISVQASGYGSSIALAAQSIALLNPSDGSYLPALIVSNDNVYFANPIYIGQGANHIIEGPGLDADGKGILYFGPSQYTAATATSANGLMFRSDGTIVDGIGALNASAGGAGAKSNSTNSANASNNSWTDVLTLTFNNIPKAGFWTQLQADISGYAANSQGATASYVSGGGRNANGSMRIVERQSGKADVVVGAPQAVAATGDSDGAQIDGSVSVLRIASNYTGQVSLVVQAECTTGSSSFSGFPADLGSSWLAAAA